MKKLFIILALFCASYSAFADVERNGNTFIQTKTNTNNNDTETKYFYEIQGQKYPIFITKNGRCYVIRISKNGNNYKYYLPEEVSRQICKELNIEYK